MLFIYATLLYKGCDIMAMSKAHIRASSKYNKANYKQLNINIKPEDFAIIDAYCTSTGISKAQLIVKACKYCINNNIDLKD